MRRIQYPHSCGSDGPHIQSLGSPFEGLRRYNGFKNPSYQNPQSIQGYCSGFNLLTEKKRMKGQESSCSEVSSRSKSPSSQRSATSSCLNKENVSYTRSSLNQSEDESSITPNKRLFNSSTMDPDLHSVNSSSCLNDYGHQTAKKIKKNLVINNQEAKSIQGNFSENYKNRYYFKLFQNDKRTLESTFTEKNSQTGSPS